MNYEDVQMEENLSDDTEQQNEINVENEGSGEKDKVDLMVELIRSHSALYKLTKAEDFFEEPIALEVEEVLPKIEEIKAREDSQDIRSIKGASTIYLYSTNHLANNYARMLARVEDKDLIKLIVETVRYESKTYPRPTDARLFTYAPFNFTKDQFEKVLSQLEGKEAYKDIQKVKASNGALYLYSEKFIVKDHASALTEWIEVLQEQCP